MNNLEEQQFPFRVGQLIQKIDQRAWWWTTGAVPRTLSLIKGLDSPVVILEVRPYISEGFEVTVISEQQVCSSRSTKEGWKSCWQILT